MPTKEEMMMWLSSPIESVKEYPTTGLIVILTLMAAAGLIIVAMLYLFRSNVSKSVEVGTQPAVDKIAEVLTSLSAEMKNGFSQLSSSIEIGIETGMENGMEKIAQSNIMQNATKSITDEIKGSAKEVGLSFDVLIGQINNNTASMKSFKQNIDGIHDNVNFIRKTLNRSDISLSKINDSIREMLKVVLVSTMSNMLAQRFGGEGESHFKEDKISTIRKESKIFRVLNKVLFDLKNGDVEAEQCASICNLIDSVNSGKIANG